MPVPSQEIEACKAAHRRLLATITSLPPEVLAAESRLPAWSVAHVLTHLARNADSVVRRLDGAREFRLVEQYERGKVGRAREVDVGVMRDPDVIKQDVIDSSAAVDRAFSDCPDDVWDRPIRLCTGEQRPATRLVTGRWREVEVHHVDLGLTYTHEDWDDAFVDRFLSQVLESLPSRTAKTELLAWALGRADAPDLAPWG